MWQYNYTPNSDDIMHYGVIGMKWGVRKGRNLGESLRTRRLKRSIKANEKDVQSLRKAGYKTEADAVAKVGQKQSEKLKKSQERDKAKADYKQQKQEKKLNNTAHKDLKKATKSGQKKTKKILSKNSGKAVKAISKSAKLGLSMAQSLYNISDTGFENRQMQSYVNLASQMSPEYRRQFMYD